jgi:hypothetical protein
MSANKFDTTICQNSHLVSYVHYTDYQQTTADMFCCCAVAVTNRDDKSNPCFKEAALLIEQISHQKI